MAIALPVSLGVFAEEVRAALAASNNPESYIRVVVSRGQGPLGLDPSLATTPLRVIFVEPFTPLPDALYRDGVAVVSTRTERAAD